MGFWSSKALGTLKDAASVGFAIMSYVGLAHTTTSTNTRFADIEVALVKATRHNAIPPKEKYLLILLAATKDHDLRCFIKYAVEDRLSRTKNWMVAVKTLALIHRLMMDVVPCIFAEEEQEMKHSSDTTPLVALSQSFEDCSNPPALQFSLWARKYSSYLAQRLQYNSTNNYVGLAEIQNFEIAQLLEDLRSLHLLLGCLLDCNPPQEGPVAANYLVHYALDLLAKDCPKIYATIKDCILKLLDYSFFDFPRDKALCFAYIYEQILQQYDKLSDFHDACARLGLTDGHADYYLSHKRFLSEMKDRIKKYRHECTHLEEEHIAKKETALKKETPQDAVEEERLLITWCGSQDDGINFGSKSSEQEANYESNHAVKEWERALDMSIKDSSSTANYHAVKEWERALDMSIMDPSSPANYQSGNGMDCMSESPNDGTRIELALNNGHRTKPFLTVEMAHNEQQRQQHQGAAMDVER